MRSAECVRANEAVLSSSLMATSYDNLSPEPTSNSKNSLSPIFRREHCIETTLESQQPACITYYRSRLM
ncbi:hypothetical protein D9M71_727340 [compost metagenome]